MLSLLSYVSFQLHTNTVRLLLSIRSPIHVHELYSTTLHGGGRPLCDARRPRGLNGVAGQDELPLVRMEQEETFDRLRQQLRELSEADRVLLTLRYAFDYDAQEIANQMGIQASAVHMRLSRARQRLAERLIEHGVIAKP
jgi:RNA polymerase sigma factor (sigma-70 family)